MSNTQTPTVQNQDKSVAPRPKWQAALMQAEGKFLAINGKQEHTKIELGFASMLIEANDKLRACDQASIVNAVINVARTGITLNPVLRLAHLVPRGGKCVLDFSYLGLVKILKDNNCIKDIQAIIVYGDEKYSESMSPIERPVHEKKYAKTEVEQGKREKLGVYCMVLLPDNTVIYTQFTPAWEILKAKAVSPGANSQYSPWQTWSEEMWKKTKIKKDFKTLISGSPDSKALAALEVAHGDNEDFDNKDQESNSKANRNVFGDVEDAVIVEEAPVEAKSEAPKQVFGNTEVPANTDFLGQIPEGTIQPKPIKSELKPSAKEKAESASTKTGELNLGS